VSLLGRQPVPAHRLGVVLRDASSLGVHDPEGELRRVSLLPKLNLGLICPVRPMKPIPKNIPILRKNPQARHSRFFAIPTDAC